MKKILEVKFGSIYSNEGIIIENMAVIFSMESGLHKYGELKQLEKIYSDENLKLRKSGLEDYANSFILIKFDKYENLLTTEEICTIVNYMVMVSGNFDNNLKMLNM